METWEKREPKKELTEADLIIWWLNPQECEEVYCQIRKEEVVLPKYLEEETRDISDRSGRGRLWVHEEFGDVLGKGIKWNNEHPNAKRINKEKRGGIVLFRHDTDAVAPLPGFVTDTELDTIEEEK